MTLIQMLKYNTQKNSGIRNWFPGNKYRTSITFMHTQYDKKYRKSITENQLQKTDEKYLLHYCKKSHLINLLREHYHWKINSKTLNHSLYWHLRNYPLLKVTVKSRTLFKYQTNKNRYHLRPSNDINTNVEVQHTKKFWNKELVSR